MLFLLFHLGRDRYALEASRVAEVLPLVRLKAIPQAPRGVVGAFSYHGTPVPVVDLSELAIGRLAEARLSTRLILARYSAGTDSREQLLGLLAERVTSTLRREAGDFVPSPVASETAPYLGPVATDERGLIQRIDLDRLLPPAVRSALFQPASAA